MRGILLALSFFIINNSFAQDSLSVIIANNICSCLNNVNTQRQTVYKDAAICAKDETQRQSELFQKEGILKYGDSITSKQANSFGQDVGLKTSVYLVNNCPVYRNIIDTARYSLYSYMNKDSLITEINKLNGAETNHNLQFFIKRGKMLFWLSKFKEAAEDAEQIIKLDSTNELGLHMKAMYLERTHDYSASLQLYIGLLDKSNNPRYALDAALVLYKIQH